MKIALIKQSPSHGRDTKIFRAYIIPDETGLNMFGRRKTESLGISATTTGNVEVGVVRCAAKAFAQHAKPKRTAEDWEGRLHAVGGGNAQWQVYEVVF